MRAVKGLKGSAHVVELPDPVVQPQFVKVKTDYSAVSVGTELLMIRVNEDADLGYSASGIVEEVGEGVTHVVPGQRVACYGVPTHRQFLHVPKHLVVPIPDGVRAEEAAFVGIGAIAIHALRQADLNFGETIIVVGLGILGQIIASIAHASNYRVIGLEPIEERCLMLESIGATACRTKEELQAAIESDPFCKGADAVLLCASNREHSMIDDAIDWLRDRGRVVIVGDTGTEFNRDLLFMKEASIHISRAGGPGRYEYAYEKQGIDYPIGYVRWTEGRNMYEFLRMLADKRIDMKLLIRNECALEDLPAMYLKCSEMPQQMMGIVVNYA
ncbi:zinc-dependent alcohol dehydrogenase [Paenibacillus eucommiae]|uniref:Threonine dehydrogenase-like Zn-dependent dehydrogenase n=1 Tax=Paenibacillus eucommiae TaxID=1355755 RepID=A0ABS4J8I5_9BACL|nr:zinc-binding alcohol dehydrogenase [Paenibacillus eucommiae]MBP1995575.1 threonine dehydrogenase-like Zn-dependent dehydrogenase [Paenibacillus eucommiae]